jgi:hypothetical protein
MRLILHNLSLDVYSIRDFRMRFFMIKCFFLMGESPKENFFSPIVFQINNPHNENKIVPEFHRRMSIAMIHRTVL